MNRFTNTLDRLNAAPSWVKATMLFAVVCLCSMALPADAIAQQRTVTEFGVGLAIIGSTLTATNPTLLDLARVMDPSGGVADIVEILNETNEMIDDATFLEGNLPTGHRTTIRTGIPAPTWRKMYQGVQPSKSTTVQVTDDCGMLEAYAQVDKALADLNGNAAAWRLSEDTAHIEGLSQELAQTLIYGNSRTEPEAFTGLAPRYASISTSTAQSADNVINAGGSGSDNTSIWLVVWGPRTVHGIIPKASKAGIQVTDKGQVTVTESDGSMWEAYRTHYRLDAGLTVRDWRYAARVCNIDVSDMATASNAKNLVGYMIQAIERIPNLGAGRPVFYMNRNLREKLRLGILEKVSSQLAWETVAGKRVTVFDGIPLKRTDAILSTEAALT